MITHPARLLHGADNYEIFTVGYKTSLEVCEPAPSLVIVWDCPANCGDNEDRRGHRVLNLLYCCITIMLGGLDSTEIGLNIYMRVNFTATYKYNKVVLAHCMGTDEIA